MNDSAESSASAQRALVALITLLCAIVALGFGSVHGFGAANSFSYFGHFFVGGLTAIVLYGLLLSLPDATPDFAMLIMAMVSIVFLITSHLTAYQVYQDDALAAEREYLRTNPSAAPGDYWRLALDDPNASGTVWDNVRLHISQGVIYSERAYITYGEQVQRIRSGFWAALAWIVQLSTPPVLIAFGVVGGAFSAHLKTHDESQYQTAMDYALEITEREMSPFGRQPAAWFDLAIAEGADPNANTSSDKPLIFTACHSSRIRFLNRLLDLGASINARDREGRTLFHQAAGQPEAEPLLVRLSEVGCDINATDHQQKTPLTVAASSELVDNLNAMVRLGADLPKNLPDLLTAAIHRQGTEALTWLLGAQGDQRHRYINDAAVVSRATAYPEALRVLLRAGMNPNLPAGNRPSMLFAAVSNCSLPSVEILLEYGADPFLEDQAGRIPRDYAFDYDGKQRAAYEAIEQRLTVAMDRLTR